MEAMNHKMPTEDTTDGFGTGAYGEGGYGDVQPEDSPDAPESGPYGGTPHPVPGRIQAENFDINGYNETTPKAEWAVDYRGTPVDLKRSPDDAEGYSVGRFQTGEWLEYTVDVTPGVYTIHVRGGTANDGSNLEFSLDGNQIATVPIPNQNGWSNYVTISQPGLRLGTEGEQVLRMSTPSGGVDVNWIDFERTGDLPDDGTDTPDLQHRLEITNDGSGTTDYQFTVSDALQQNLEVGSDGSNDTVEGQTATGQTRGETDVYDYAGEIVSAEWSGIAPTVRHNGETVSLAELSKTMTQSATITLQMEEQGGLTVVVTDGNGNPLPGVTVSLAGEALDSAKEQETGDNGEVVFSGLAVASYTVTATKTGYFEATGSVAAEDFSSTTDSGSGSSGGAD